jgi:hypothetical protein
MILFLGIAPGNHPPEKSPTLKRVRYWMDSVGIKEYGFTNLVDYKAPKLKLSEIDVEEVANKLKGYSHIIALGNLPSTFLEKNLVPHLKVPHPSGLNRIWNDKSVEPQVIENIRGFTKQ